MVRNCSGKDFVRMGWELFMMMIDLRYPFWSIIYFRKIIELCMAYLPCGTLPYLVYPDSERSFCMVISW